MLLCMYPVGVRSDLPITQPNRASRFSRFAWVGVDGVWYQAMVPGNQVAVEL